MLRLLADENLNVRIVRGLQRRIPDLDIVRVQDVGLRGASDEDVLDWAAAQNRLVLTHDVATMTRFAYDRVRAGLPMPGVIEIGFDLAIGPVLEDLYLLVMTSRPGEWEGRIVYLPL